MMGSDNRLIGRVLSVDNFRVFIKIEEDLRGSYKSGILDIYEVARINSYLIIPVGSDRIVALITRVTMKEEVEFGKNSTSISLPTSARYISATMLGTIAKENDTEKFIQGVYNFPSLDNPVWYVTEKDLQHIFDDKPDEETKFEKDYYLPIGTSPAFSDYKVKISPDQFFVKHAAILGNTGSGKSCTLTSILRNLFRYNYNGSRLQNAHIVIFDTNGEYKDAFLPIEEEFRKLDTETQNELKLINANYYGGEDKVQVPYWLMNWSDFKGLFNPTEATQAPLLISAIGLAKNNHESSAAAILPTFLRNDIEGIIISSSEDIKKRTGIASYGNWSWLRNNQIYSIGVAASEYDMELGTYIQQLGDSNNFNRTDLIEPIRLNIERCYSTLIADAANTQITSTLNIDLPVYFNYQELCTKFLDAAIKTEGSGNPRLNEYVSTMRMRMNSFLNDKRMAVPLMLKDTEEINRNVLPRFLAFLLGDYNAVFNEDAPDDFIKKYNDTLKHHNKTRANQVNIIDVSQLPFEVLETVTALLGRIILEFVSHFVPADRGKYPIVIVLEEAQNYIAEYKYSVAKTVFERIAREGRKYGISLIVSSQRPSELSKTVLSQCNSFIIHRLQNPEDQKYIRGLVSSANADILDQLPVIPQQNAIITGDCVRAPIQVRIDSVHPTPNSHNPKYITNWLMSDKIPYQATVDRWLTTDDAEQDI